MHIIFLISGVEVDLAKQICHPTLLSEFGFPQAIVVGEAYITAVASQCNLTPEQVSHQSEHPNKILTSFVQIYVEYLCILIDDVSF